MSKKETAVKVLRAADKTTSYATLDIDAVYETEDLIAQTGAFLDLENVEEFAEPSLGTHRVVIQEWLNQPETTTHPDRDKWAPEEERHYDARLELHLRDDEGGALYRKFVYAKGLANFAKNLNRQARGKLAGMSVAQRLDYFKTNELDIWVVWSDEFSCPVIYFYDVEAFMARKQS